MSPLTWILLFTGVGLNAAAQLLLKAATRTSGALVAGDGVSWSAVARLLTAPPLWVGLGCYGVSVVVWLGALSRVPVSIAYPMLSIGYVVNLFLAALLFGEALSLPKLAGVALICAGVIVLARAQHS